MKLGQSEHFLVNLIGFQICWWAAILLQESSVILLLPILAAHLAFHSDRHNEAHLIAVVAALGYGFDSLLMQIGFYQFQHASLLPPLWLALLWCCFAATLRQTLWALRNHRLLAALLGGVAGSASYLVGAQLGAVELGYERNTSALVLASFWALMLPLALRFGQRLQRLNREVTQ